MQNQSDNVILFPKWKLTLEEESLQALKEKRYEEALVKLDKLLSYHTDNHEIVIGKLICLMELGRYDEAQDLCEELLQVKSDNYYHYVHIYLTILFQTNQYDLLMDQVEYELEEKLIPDMIKEQFQQLYDMSEKMKDNIIDEKSTVYFDDFFLAVKQGNHIDQWRLIESLRRMKSNPTSEMMSFLENEQVHPVTKTAIFNWLQDKQVSQQVEIHKRNTHLSVKPSEVVDICSDGTIKQIILLISALEQKNPTLYKMIDQLLFRYAYVWYPVIPPSEDVTIIAQALINIGEQYLNIHTDNNEEINEDVLQYMEEIKASESLYSSIIEE